MRLCGVSLIFITAFFALVVFFSIFITAFFLPDLPGVDVGSIVMGRVSARLRDSVNGSSPAIVDLLEADEDDEDEEGGEGMIGVPQNTSRLGGSGGGKRVVRPVNELSVVWDFGTKYCALVYACMLARNMCARSVFVVLSHVCSGACGCTGWGIEAVNFVLPLHARLPHFGIVSGPDCFCSGTDAQSLRQLAAMRATAARLAERTRMPRAHAIAAERHHADSVVYVPRVEPRRRHRASALVGSNSDPMAVHTPHTNGTDLRRVSILTNVRNPLDAVVNRLERMARRRRKPSKAPRRSLLAINIGAAHRIVSAPAVSATKPPSASLSNAGGQNDDDGGADDNGRQHSFFRLLRPKPDAPREPLPPFRGTPVDIWISHKPPQRFPRWPYLGILHFHQRPRFIVGRSMSEVWVTNSRDFSALFLLMSI
jgi:hypothetical protein